MQALNHSIKAIEQLRHGGSPHAPLSTLGLQYIVRKLEQAQKFILPAGGRLFDPDKKKPEVPGLVFRPPFPVVALEYQMEPRPHDAIPSIYNGSHAPKRIALAWDWQNDFPAPLCGTGMPPAGSGVMIAEISYRTELDQWTPGLAAAFIPYEGEWRDRPTTPAFVQDMVKRGAVKAKLLDGRAYDMSMITLMPEALAEKALYCGSIRAAIDMVQADTNDELIAYVELCYVLACSNVQIDKLPAPERLNAARLKAGKAALPDYHILKLTTRDDGHGNFGPVPHGSPRPHLRRGHIRHLRHLGPDRITWVNSAMVRGRGAGGFADKAYAVEARP